MSIERQTSHADEQLNADMLRDELDDTDDAETESSELDGEGDSSLADALNDIDGTKKDDQPKKAEQSKNHQIDVWTERIVSGEASIDDLPKNLAWLKKPIQNRLEILKEQANLDTLIEKAVEKKLSEKEQKVKTDQVEAQFQSMTEKLESADLSDEKRKVLLQEYRDLRSSGLNKAIALEKALKIAQVSIAEGDNDPAARELFAAMALPKNSGRPTKEQKPADIDNVKSKSEKERLAYWESVRTNG